jgi:hypothetical protein
MKSDSCSRCAGWTGSPKRALDVLNARWSACDNCAEQKVIRVVSEQFRLRQPRWWTVGGTVVVPIWIVELLKGY